MKQRARMIGIIRHVGSRRKSYSAKITRVRKFTGPIRGHYQQPGAPKALNASENVGQVAQSLSMHTVSRKRSNQTELRAYKRMAVHSFYGRPPIPATSVLLLRVLRKKK